MMATRSNKDVHFRLAQWTATLHCRQNKQEFVTPYQPNILRGQVDSPAHLTSFQEEADIRLSM